MKNLINSQYQSFPVFEFLVSLLQKLTSHEKKLSVLQCEIVCFNRMQPSPKMGHSKLHITYFEPKQEAEKLGQLSDLASSQLSKAALKLSSPAANLLFQLRKQFLKRTNLYVKHGTYLYIFSSFCRIEQTARRDLILIFGSAHFSSLHFTK